MKTFWYLVRTQPSRERYAAKNIRRQNVEAFLPMIEDKRGREEVLFPSYLFVRTYGQYHFIENTYGCSGIVKFGEQPAIVPHRVIRALKRMVKDNEQVVLPRHPKKYVEGEELRIKPGSGPFSFHLGIYQGMTADKRVCILIDLMSRKVSLVMDAHQVERAAA